MHLESAASVADYRALARRRLPAMLFDYIDGGASDEVTLERNVADFRRICLKQTVMRDTSSVDLRTQMFGQTLSMPVVLGPVGFAGMYARRGEAQAARAAAKAGLAFCLSTVGICSIEEVAAAAPGPWFQLYIMRDREFLRELLARVWEAGAKVLVLTVDLPVPGARRRDVRSGMAAKPGVRAWLRQALDGIERPGWMWNVWVNGRPHGFGNLPEAVRRSRGFADAWAWIRENYDDSVTWQDLAFVRQHWKGAIVVKGVLTPEDAHAAIESGADGLVVSNHGGRQLDSAPSSISALPRVGEATRGRAALLLDGGVRSGVDVLKALALGADAVMLGRAWAYALSAGGEAAVGRMLQTLQSELRTTMVLTSCKRVQDAGPEILDRTM